MTLTLGLMLGLAYVVSPGPVNIATLRCGLTGGARAALAVQLGSILGDLLWASLALAGVGLLLIHPTAQMTLGITSTGLLIYLGWAALRSWQTLTLSASPGDPADSSNQSAIPTTRRMLWTGVAIATANPFAPVFWVSVGGALGGSAQQPLMFLSGFGIGALLAGVGIALLVGLWQTRLTPQFVRVAISGCGLALIGCGLTVGYTTLLG